ncbi:MAG TPA: hypothetical protein VH442_01570, partial [Micromonosporaceae bacterium]
GGFSFNRWLNSLWSHPWLLFLAPIAVGVGGTVWGGDAAMGRRAARLAAVSAALSIYLYGVLAVAVIGATGHDPSDGWTPAQIVDDNLANQATFYLLALPLMTATVGWAAAAATTRLRQALPAIVAPATTPTISGGEPTLTGAMPTIEPESRATPGVTTRQRRIWYAIVLCAATVAVAFLVFLAFLSQR